MQRRLAAIMVADFVGYADDGILVQALAAAGGHEDNCNRRQPIPVGCLQLRNGADNLSY